MKYDKIMAGGNLDNITGRLVGCVAVLRALHASADDPGPDFRDALYGAIDLPESICRDRQADIDSAEDFDGRERSS